LRIVTSAAIAYILTASFNLIFGYAGLFSLAHVALYGIGGYSCVYLIDRLGISFWVAVPIAMLFAGLMGVIVAIPTARLGGIFLALGTLAFGIAAEEVFLQWTGVTGGAQGFLGIQPPTFFGVELVGGELPYYWLTAAAALVSFEVIYRASTSRFGRRLVALRESEVATEASGISPFAVRLSVFAISGAFAGLAGSLFAHFALFISPESFSLGKMIEVLIVLLLGGAGTVMGPVLGVIALVFIEEGGHQFGDAHSLFYGIAIVVVIAIAPRGLVGIVTRIWARLRPRRSAGPAAVPPEPHAVVTEDVTRGAQHLVAEEVSVAFAGLMALDEVSLELRRGQVLGLIGPNGAGKTTLVNAVTGRVHPVSGHVRLDDRDVTEMRPYELPRHGVTRTFQTTQMIGSFTLVENVMVGRELFGRATLPEQVLGLPRSQRDDADARATAIGLLRVVGVGDYAGQRAADVPFGVLKRAEIARAMALMPSFLLLDEPGAGLSGYEREEVAEAIRQVSSRGVGCILIDHNVEFVASVCSDLVVLAAGRTLAEGATAEVLERHEVVEAYLGKGMGV
jgi:ABC-type branched-subunit amino acid transport system ATPase component/ABC-type branched-subunit amino acid transport system permease subunit